ncbi:aldehyde dehydrogenase [Pseudohyphozyma bogoriensis]|nr:aldehyde dehydrogenase [Pseudohyphozyma bogoriensis]
MSTISSVPIAGRAAIECPTGLFINNAFVKGRGKPIESIDPSTGRSVLAGGATVSGASKEDVDDAVGAASKAFKTTWGLNITGTDRSRLMHKLADLIERDQEEISVLETADAGKPIGWSRADVVDTVACLRYYAGWADKIIGQTLELNNKTKQAYTKHEPIGVVGQIVPWNYPILMWAWKVAPALAVGCTIVFKPAENTPLSILKIAALFVEAGFPAGVFNVVNGHGAETGVAISEHPNIDKIAFTGSTATGRAITIAAAKSNLKKVTLELGGKSANIIFPSADLEQAVNWAALGVFENAGQSCSAGTRVLVHESIKDKFEGLIKAAAESIKLGSPQDEETWQGPQVSKAQFEKIMEYIEIGKKEGARVLTGGERWGKEGYFIKPTIFTDVDPKSRVCREEIFGPVLCVIPFKTEEEAIALANDSEYGLGAGLHSKDADQIARVSNALEAGTVWINSYTFLANNAPFGGYKTSGWGRELGSYGLEEYISVKAVHHNYGEKIDFPCKL